MNSPTNTEIANSFFLWGQYVDPSGLDTEEAFNAKSEAEKLAFIEQCFPLTKLTHKEMMTAFRDATAGKRVDMTVNEIVALVDSIEAKTHAEAVNEILIELGWKERE
jgi:hypothetical protein